MLDEERRRKGLGREEFIKYSSALASFPIWSPSSCPTNRTSPAIDSLLISHPNIKSPFGCPVALAARSLPLLPWGLWTDVPFMSQGEASREGTWDADSNRIWVYQFNNHFLLRTRRNIGDCTLLFVNIMYIIVMIERRSNALSYIPQSFEKILYAAVTLKV